MCLTLPAKIISIKNTKAIVVDFRNNQKEVIIAALPEIKVNSWVLISANLAIKEIPETEALELIDILRS
jgi:hydrogenase maturation factor